MPKNPEYIVTKLEKADKAWPELLDKSIENALKNKESSKELIEFYTTVKIAIWQHLSSIFEQIIKDIRKAASQLKHPIRERKALNVLSPASPVAMFIDDVDPASQLKHPIRERKALNVLSPAPPEAMFIDDVGPAAEIIAPASRCRPESSNDLPDLKQSILLNDIIEKMFDYKQPQDLQIMLVAFDAPRIIATLVSGYLVNAMQANLTSLGVVECEKLYSRAVIRVIVEKQLGSNGRLTDYNALIKLLTKTRTNNGKVLPLLVGTLIKSAQMGNPYTRTMDRQNVSIPKTIASSKAFTKYGLTSVVFKPRADFLQFANADYPTLLFPAASCFSFKRKLLLTQYFQLKDTSSFLPAEMFFTKAAADYGDAESQFNYGVDIFINDKTAAGLSLADKYWQLAAQRGIIAAKHNHELFLFNARNSNRDKEQTLNPNALNIDIENFRAKNQDNKSPLIVKSLLPPAMNKQLPKLNVNNKKTTIDILDLTKKSERLKVASQKTKPAFSSMSDNGAYPIAAKIVKSEVRSYKKHRDVQLLRHITTQLYGFCRINKADAIEVQAMYYANSLYIATNMINAARLITDMLKNGRAMKTALIFAYSCGDSSKQKISKRHAHKIRTRIYRQYDFGNERANIIKTLLNNDLLKIKPLDISGLNTNSRSFKHEPNNIYVVTNRSQGLVRHAEEDLIDILEAMYKVSGRLYEKPLIYGKRRPCFSCYSRLDSLQDENGPYAEFNPKPGLFFVSAFCSQSTVAATETFYRLSTVSTIYKSADDAGYNTLSDSEDEGYRGMDMRS